MRYAFFGTPEFAAIILEKLISAGFIPEAVICNPDKPFGRKKIITPPPVKRLIANRIRQPAEQIAIFQPEKLSTISDKLSAIHPDIFIVAAYGKIIPKEILEIPKLGVIGVHPSLLPKYRGVSPIQTAILNGETETGVTLYLMDEKIDNGPIINKSEIRISKSETYELLLKKLAELGGNLLVENLPRFLANEIKPQEQNHSDATFTKKFKTEDAFIENSDLETAINAGGNDAVKVYNKIRALNPEPGTWTIKNNKRMKILESELTPENKLKLKTIQFEGKKPFKN